MDRYDEEAEQRSAAVVEVAARLRTRGITVTGAERPEELADLLSAVERFEAAVEAHGGDLMVDDLKSAQPWCPGAGTARPCGPTSGASTRRRRGCAATRGSPTERRT